jgi:hypothetical protein
MARAARNFSRVQALNPEVKILAGSFSVDDSDNACTLMQGLGFSPVWLAAGEYAIDLDNPFGNLLAAIVQSKHAAAADKNAQIASYHTGIAEAAELELQDLTYTAKATGRSGNDLTVTYTAAEAAVGTLNLTADITLTKSVVGSAQNTKTFTLQVVAAAANPTDTVLVAFTGTSAAIICTVTPNDGTNNTATPVDLTTAELAELINDGSVVGKTVTLTDASSFRTLQTATGGGATALADSGEGDGVVATYASGTGIAAGAVASIVGSDIDVIIEDGVTPASAIKTAVDGLHAAAQLVTVDVTGTAATAQDAATIESLAGGVVPGLIVRNLATATPSDSDCEIHFSLYLLNTNLT